MRALGCIRCASHCFANGMKAKELIVDVVETTQRVVWSAVGGRLTHHNASAQVLATDVGAYDVLWLADLLPHDLAAAIADMIEQELRAMKHTLEAHAS